MGIRRFVMLAFSAIPGKITCGDISLRAPSDSNDCELLVIILVF